MLGFERRHLACRRIGGENLGGPGAAKIETAAKKAETDAGGILAVGLERALNSGS
ncbi:MAG: hypothetical protein WDN31_18435 [Hyphomicrobium sp.]